MNTGKVFGFEFKSLVRKKAYKYTTLIISIILIFLTFLPRFFEDDLTNKVGIFEGASFDLENVDFSDTQVYVADKNIDIDYLSSLMKLNEDQIIKDRETLEENIVDSKIHKGLIINGPNTFKVLIKDKKFAEDNINDIKAILNKYNFDMALMKEGINPTNVEDASNTNLVYEEVVLGKDLSSNFLLAYSYIIILFMLIIFYGNNISSNVAREKNDRTMEILITSTSPTSLIIGKVLGSGIAGLLQFGIFGLVSFIGMYINKNFYSQGMIDFLKSMVDWKIIAVFFGFILIGYFIYLFLFAALGAKVSKVEDVTGATLPIYIIFIAGFILTVFQLANADGIVLKVLSFIPFTSPIAMPVRFLLTLVPIVEVFISVGVLIVTMIILAIISSKIYRNGTKNYGRKY